MLRIKGEVPTETKITIATGLGIFLLVLWLVFHPILDTI
jgi:hypothetical protein